MSNNYYVYLHKEGDEIVYVGVGSGGRAYTHVGRKADHLPWMLSYLDNGDSSFVSFHSLHLSRQEALEIESKLIQELQPKFNRFFTDSWKEMNKTRGLKGSEKTKKKCVTPLGTFNSLTEAAAAHGYKHGASIYWNIRNNKQGFYYV